MTWNGARDNRGFIKGLFWFVVLVALAYVGISFGKPYYRYNTLESHTKDILVVETGYSENLPRLKEKILEEARKLKIPLSEDNISLSFNGASKVVTVRAKWSEVVNFWDYYSTRLNFDMNVED